MYRNKHNMDDREEGQHWFTNQGVSTSPSRHPALTDPGGSGDGTSFSQGTGRQQHSAPYNWGPSGWHASPDTQNRQHSGTSSQTAREKRRRRSSSFDERQHHRIYEGEARGRDHWRPPTARRQRVANESENNWRTQASGSPPAETRITSQTSRGLSPQGCRTPQEGPTPYWGDISDNTRQSWNPQNPISSEIQSREGNWYSCDMGRITDVPMTSGSPARPQQADGHGSIGMVGWPNGQYHSSSTAPNWNACQGWDICYRQPAQERVMRTPWGNSQRLGDAHEAGPVAQSYGATYGIGNAGNVLTGINNGNVYMESVTVQLNDEFMINLADRLKNCVRAHHMYHASGEEIALRRGQCTPGTRIDIIGGVTSWATNTSPGSELVYWLSGQAGAGKTTIAYTIACHFETMIGQGNSRVILGGTFFCSRHFPDTRSASSIIRTIVYQLALRSKSFQDALKEHGRFETVDYGPKSQLTGLLVEPWKKSAPGRLAVNEPCYVLPIDALDELDGESGSEFLGILFDVLEQQDLSGLKFFITSRSHPALVDRVKSFSNKQVCRLEEVPLNESSADIMVYLSTNLRRCATPKQIQGLVLDAAGLFIYASTVVEYVKGRNLEEQRKLLKNLLSISPSTSHRRPRNATAKLDSLYLQILETWLVDPRDHGDPDVFQDCLLILHTFLCTIERTSVTVVVAILQEISKQSEIDKGTAEGVLLRLHAVLYLQDGQVMSFHKSFSDFLFDKGRSNVFYCNQEQLHHRLAVGCFWVMTKQLRFNIADIPSSFMMDCDNPALPTCIDTNISVPLRYACRNWSAHLILTPEEAWDEFADIMHQILQLRILFWMESMNLLGQRGHCQGMLRDAQRWFAKSTDSTGIVGKLADAAAFAAYHSASKGALSTPHLYLSSLATYSRDSTIVQNWRQQFCGIPGFISAYGVGDEALIACIALRSEPTALAVSPDGVSVTVGSFDGLVRVLNATTGQEAMVLIGHQAKVRAVAYSPDGTRVVSGSDDRSLRVWDVATGEERRVLKGHTSSVNAVAYSPNGSHIVSGSSWDNSLRIWDVSTGEEVRVLRGHTNGISAVTYSPDGRQIITSSGSSDDSLHIWDMSTGGVRVLMRHTEPAYVVAYSPDGCHIASGSRDNSLRIWDVSTGKEVRVFKGHTKPVYAVAYSPDGTHVVSGSDDNSIRVWEVSTGKEVRVLEGHSMHVRAVAYLPNGTHIVSSSGDKSVRVWDVSAGEERRVLKGHTSWVHTVAYSPNGSHIVSGSRDNSLRIWDVSTGEEVRVLRGHTKPVVDTG